MGRMARWEEAIKRPPLTDEDRARLAVQAAELEELRAAEFTCPYCEDARAIRPRAGVVVPCPECVTVETRMAMAGVPDQFHDVRLEAMETLDGKKAAIVAAARWNLADSVLVFSRGRPVDKAFGTGKTMLACAMLRRVLEARGRTVRFVDAQDLLERMKAAMDAERGQGERAMEDAIEVDVLVLDDIGAERATEWAIDRLSYLIRERYARQRTTIITTNLMSPEQVEGVFGGRVASRLSSYLWVPMGGDDLRHRERGQR